MVPRDVRVRVQDLLPSREDSAFVTFPGEVSRGQHSVIPSLLQPQNCAARDLLQEIKLFCLWMRINLKVLALFLALCHIIKLLFRKQPTVPTSLLM